MRASFSNGDLTGGIVTGLRMLADSAGTSDAYLRRRSRGQRCVGSAGRTSTWRLRSARATSERPSLIKRLSAVARRLRVRNSSAASTVAVEIVDGQVGNSPMHRVLGDLARAPLPHAGGCRRSSAPAYGAQLALQRVRRSRDRRRAGSRWAAVVVDDRAARPRPWPPRSAAAPAPSRRAAAGRGRVALELGLDVVLPVRPARDRACTQRPAQVGVDRQSVEVVRAVEQPAHERQVLVAARRAEQRVHPASWWSEPGCGAAQRVERRRRRALRSPAAPTAGRRRSRAHAAPGGSATACTPMSVSCVGAGDHHGDVVAGGELAVAGHVPRRRPAQRARQRVGQLRDPAGAQRRAGCCSSRRSLQ